MTPENIAGFAIPEAQLKDLIDALHAMRGEAIVVPIRPSLPKAA